MTSISNSKLLRLSNMYQVKILPKTKRFRGASRLSSLLHDLTLKSVYIEEDGSIIVNITENESRKLKSTEDLKKYITNEFRLSKILINEIEPEDVFYDVGAYHGYHSILGTLGKKAYSFEPDPENLNILRKNVELNTDQEIHIVERPVWDSEETVAFTAGKGGKSHIGGNHIERKSVSLDGFVFEEENTAPDFIKIDVEGAEYRVLKGSERILNEFNPTVLIELHIGERMQDMGGSRQQIEELMEEHDYKLKEEILRGGEIHQLWKSSRNQ